MFDKLKQLGELMKMKRALENERVVIEKNGVSVVVRGSFEIEEIKLNPNLAPESQEKLLKDVLNEAREEIQKKVAGNLQL